MLTILAIDQSTSATKGLLFNELGQSLDRASREHRQIYPQAGWVEHDAEEIWQNLVWVVKKLIERQSNASKDLAALSISNQRETLVVFDKQSGKPLHNAIVWQCRRSEALCAEHLAAGSDPWLHSLTGLHIDPYFSASKLQWLMQNRPEIKEKILSGEGLVGTIDSYLIYRLTQGKVFATDSTNASRTLLYDINKLTWDDKLCELWQVPRHALPEVRESSAFFGDTDVDGILKKPIPISGVMGDSQAALFAQRGFKPGLAKVTFGTGSSVLLNIGNKPSFSARGVVTALAWEINRKATYAYEGIIINSAACLDWLINQLGIASNLEALLELVKNVENTQGVYLVPAFSGLGLPHWQAKARAAIVGLSAHSQHRHIARAGLESIAYQLKDALYAMQQDSGVALNSIRADGGPSSNQQLMQFTADIAQSQLKVSQTADCSALGAALMGMLGLGIYSSLEAIENLRFSETLYTPTMQQSQVDELYGGWKVAVKQVLSGIN